MMAHMPAWVSGMWHFTSLPQPLATAYNGRIVSAANWIWLCAAVSYGGSLDETTPADIAALQAKNKMFTALLDKASALREAIKSQDVKTARALMDQASEAVVQQANIPLVWPTSNNVNGPAVDFGLYNIKNQGSTTMCCSYAVVAALEGAMDAASKSKWPLDSAACSLAIEQCSSGLGVSPAVSVLLQRLHASQWLVSTIHRIPITTYKIWPWLMYGNACSPHYTIF